jgi:transposase
VSSSISGAIEIQVGLLHRVRVCDDFASDTLERVLDVLRRQQ